MFVVDPSIEILVADYTTKLRAPFAALQQLLGPPSADVPEKCSTFWSLRDEATKDRGVYLQDWQDEDDRSFKVDVFRSLPSYDWDVWASDEETGKKLCRWLSARVIAKLGEVKTLGPAGKAELNRLLAEGVPFAEAMKRVPTESPQDLAKRFAWPIRTRS